ncbi:MAG: sialidase family protein [Acidimicrobiales bacterium]
MLATYAGGACTTGGGVAVRWITGLMGSSMAGMLALVGAATSAAAATGPQVSPSVLASAPTSIARTAEAPSLLVDNRDPATIYLAYADLAAGVCHFQFSHDSGLSWKTGTAPSLAPYTNCGMGSVGPQNKRTQLDQAPNGTLYYLYAAQVPGAGGARSLLLGRSTNGGATWQVSPVDAAPPSVPNQPIELDFEGHMAIDPSNPQVIYAMWRRSYSAAATPPHTQTKAKPPPTRPWMAESTNGGASFGAPFEMLDANPGFDGPRPIVVGTTLYAFYRVAPASSSSGASPPTVLDSAVSTDGGHHWATSQIASAGDASEPVPIYDPTRKAFYVVWHDNRSGHLETYFSRSTDLISTKGASDSSTAQWSAPVRLDDDPQVTLAGHYYPQIALAPNGRIVVAWYDYRNDPHPLKPPKKGKALSLFSNLGSDADVYMTYSTDGGTTWAPNLRVNDLAIDRTKGTWNPQYFIVVPPSVVATDTSTLVAWSDTRNGNADGSTQDIYTGLVSFDSTGPAGRVLTDPVGIHAGLGSFGVSPAATHTDLYAIIAGIAGVLIGAGLAMLVAVGILRRRRGSPQQS